jgi:uncharacterized BrkB/YihY/UPF0761 family membrane protein
MPFLLKHVQLSWPEIVKRTLRKALWNDNCPALAAQLAYYFFFALFARCCFWSRLPATFPSPI